MYRMCGTGRFPVQRNARRIRRLMARRPTSSDDCSELWTKRLQKLHLMASNAELKIAADVLGVFQYFLPLRQLSEEFREPGVIVWLWRSSSQRQKGMSPYATFSNLLVCVFRVERRLGQVLIPLGHHAWDSRRRSTKSADSLEIRAWSVNERHGFTNDSERRSRSGQNWIREFFERAAAWKRIKEADFAKIVVNARKNGGEIEIEERYVGPCTGCTRKWGKVD